MKVGSELSRYSVTVLLLIFIATKKLQLTDLYMHLAHVTRICAGI